MDTQVPSEKREENTQENKAGDGIGACFQQLKNTSTHLQFKIYFFCCLLSRLTFRLKILHLIFIDITHMGHGVANN